MATWLEELKVGDSVFRCSGGFDSSMEKLLITSATKTQVGIFSSRYSRRNGRGIGFAGGILRQFNQDEWDAELKARKDAKTVAFARRLLEGKITPDQARAILAIMQPKQEVV